MTRAGRMRAAWAAGHACVAGVALARRLPALDPPSLFPDDTWVAFLVRFSGPLDLFTYNASAPMGWVAALVPFSRLDPDPERGLQWLPIACGVLMLPLLGSLVRRTTGSAALGLLAAALLAVNPIHLRYAVRVKQFTSDALVTTALFRFGLPLLASGDARRWARFAAGAFAGVVLSWVSALPAALLVNAAALRAVLDAVRRRLSWPREILAVAAGFDLALVAYAFLRLRYQTRDGLERFWNDYYLPLDSIGAALRFLADPGAQFVVGAFPPGLKAAGAVLALAGLGILLRRPGTRWAGLVLAAVPGALLVASAARLYPLGGGRTDLFAFPLWILLAMVGLGALGARIARARPRARALGTPLALTCASALLVAFPKKSFYWPRAEGAQLVAQLEAMRQPDDALLMTPSSAWTYAVYGHDPVEPVFERSLEHKSTIRPLRPGVAFVPRDGPPFSPELLHGRRRAWFFVVFPRVLGDDVARVERAFAAAGFARTQSIPARDMRLLRFERER
jgi:hypothetical protein